MARKTLAQLFDGLEAAAPSPAGGTAAAVVAAMAASLVVMVGRGSLQWSGGVDAADRAAVLRDRLLVLGDDDVQAFGAVLSAFRTPRDSNPRARRGELTAALLGAAEVPLEIAERAADVAELARSAARDGRGPMRLDADAAAVLAEAATRAAALLVSGNLSALPADEPGGPARSLLERARAAQERAAG